MLRFNKAKDSPLRFMLHELMLYRPTREEFNPEEVESLYDESYNDERKVDIVKRQVMEHLEGVEEARYYVEEVKKQLDTTDTAIKLDPTLQQDNADCDEEVTEEHPDYIHIDPGQLDNDLN